MKLYGFPLRGRKVTKSHGFGEGSIIAKWKRKYRGWSPEEAWFILTNLYDLENALIAYQNRKSSTCLGQFR